MPGDKSIVIEVKFDGAPASEVSDALEKTSRLDLVHNKAGFLDCTFTTRLFNINH